jgi:ACS family tartrate transporter-like MFS transporter
MEGLPAILLGFVVWVYLTDYPAEAHWLSDDERYWLLATLRDEFATAPVPGPASPFAAFREVRIWVLCLVYFGLTTVMYGIGLWLPTLIHSLSGLGNVGIGILSAIPYLAAAMVMVIAGLHSDRTGERRWHTALPGFVGAGALVIAAYSSSVGLSVAAISVAMLCTFSTMGPFWAVPTRVLSGAAAAVGIAVINSVGNLGGFAGPWIIGAVRKMTGTFRGGLLAVAAGLALSGIMVLTVRTAAHSDLPGSSQR